jgi:hypothetical protein
MKQKCIINGETIYIEHDNNEVLLWIDDGYCCCRDGLYSSPINICPVCGFQPERSKREDLDCEQCKKLINQLDYIVCDGCWMHLDKYIDKSKIRCSEHCENNK